MAATRASNVTCVAWPKDTSCVLREPIDEEEPYISARVPVFPRVLGTVTVHAATPIGTGALFEDARSKVQHVLPLYRVLYTSSYTTGPGHPCHAAMKRAFSELDRALAWSRDADTDTYTVSMKRTARVCVQVRDLVLLFHKSGLEVRGDKPAVTKTLAKTLAKMVSGAGVTAPNFARIVTINGRQGGVGVMSLREFLEQMVVVQVGTGPRDTLGSALDRLVHLGGQYVTKYLFDTFGEEEDNADEEVCDDTGAPVLVSEWVRRHLDAGVLSGADADHARHFLNKQSTSGSNRSKSRSKTEVETDADDEDASAPQMVRFLDAEKGKVLFPPKCRPSDMGSVAACRWTLANTLETLVEFDSRMVLLQRPAMKRVFDVSYTSDSMQRSFLTCAAERAHQKARRRREKLDRTRRAVRDAYEDL